MNINSDILHYFLWDDNKSDIEALLKKSPETLELGDELVKIVCKKWLQEKIIQIALRIFTGGIYYFFEKHHITSNKELNLRFKQFYEGKKQVEAVKKAAAAVLAKPSLEKAAAEIAAREKAAREKAAAALVAREKDRAAAELADRERIAQVRAALESAAREKTALERAAAESAAREKRVAAELAAREKTRAAAAALTAEKERAAAAALAAKQEKTATKIVSIAPSSKVKARTLTPQQAATVLQRRWRKKTDKDLSKFVKICQQPVPDNCKEILKSYTCKMPTSHSDQNKVIFGRAAEIKNSLSKEYYVFSHGTQGHIGLFHDLFDILDAKNCSVPPAQKRFRIPGKPIPFKNYNDYRSSHHASKRDNEINASILSCDGYMLNQDNCESAWYFFDQSYSIVANPSSISQELTSYAVTNSTARSYIEKEIKMGLAKAPTKGRYYLIAIPKKTVENSLSNYTWRAHPYGVECKCSYDSYIPSLNQHQNGKVKTCATGGSYLNPQYRMLTHNLDLDKEKKVFSFNPFTAAQRAEYTTMVVKLRRDIWLLRNLEQINEHTPKEQILHILLNIDFRKTDENYWQAITEIAGKKAAIFARSKEYLQAELPPEQRLLLGMPQHEDLKSAPKLLKIVLNKLPLASPEALLCHGSLDLKKCSMKDLELLQVYLKNNEKVLEPLRDRLAPEVHFLLGWKVDKASLALPEIFIKEKTAEKIAAEDLAHLSFEEGEKFVARIEFGELTTPKLYYWKLLAELKTARLSDHKREWIRMQLIGFYRLETDLETYVQKFKGKKTLIPWNDSGLNFGVSLNNESEKELRTLFTHGPEMLRQAAPLSGTPSEMQTFFDEAFDDGYGSGSYQARCAILVDYLEKQLY